MYKCFTSELLFREWQRSDEDTQTWDADNCTGKHQARMRVRASEHEGSGEDSGRFLVEHRAGDPGHTGDRDQIPSFASASFCTMVCSPRK